MDWALIENIPEERAQDGNGLPGGNASSLFCRPGDPITQIAREDFFDNVGELYEREACRNNTPPEPCGRIHGCGASSGAQNGYLSGTRSIVRLGKYDKASIECSFAPYDRLGECNPCIYRHSFFETFKGQVTKLARTRIQLLTDTGRRYFW